MRDRISKPVTRRDAADKLSGAARYIGDMKLEGMLYAVTLRSTEARAKLEAVEYPRLPEGYFVVDRHDVPGRNRVKMLLDDQPFFAEDVVNYIGEPISLIVGSDRSIISSILSETKIRYQKLQPIFDIDEINSPPIYGANNNFADYSLKKGDMHLARAKAKYVYEGIYETGFQEQFYLEPKGVMAEYKAGKMTIYGSLQCPYYVKNAVAACMGFSEEQVRIVQATTGGAFGGKEDYPSLIAGQAACAAMKAGKPVCLLFERNEDLEATTKRHPSKIRLKSYIDESYRVLGMEADIALDAGAYAGLSGVVLQRAMFAAAGVYDIENLSIKGKAIATNKAVSGAFRGFGSPQAFFAIEMHMEHAAKAIGIDPLQYKLLNLVKQGSTTSTNGVYRDNILLPQMIDRVLALSGYEEKKKAFIEERLQGKLKGIGISIFFHGCGFTGNGEQDHIKGRVRLLKDRDDKVEILVSTVEMGQGTQTIMRKIAAEALELPLEDIIYENPDTDRVPDSGPTVASRTTVIVGKLVYDAALQLKAKWQAGVASEAEVQYSYPEGFVWDNDKFQGDAYTNYSWGVNAIEVELDPITYETAIKGVWAVYDIGNSIDDRMTRGQIDGGIVQGLGYASMEVMENLQGRFRQRSSTDYIIPTAMDIPLIQSELMCESYKGGPYGAKGLGELTFVGAPIAYALAVGDALGINMDALPIRPEHLMEVAADDKKY